MLRAILTAVFPPHRVPTDAGLETIREILRQRPRSSALDLLRLAFLADIVHVGRTGVTITSATFMAAAMGPMNERLLSEAKACVSARRRDRTRRSDAPHPLPHSAITAITTVCRSFDDASSSSIVATIHRDGGSWAACYETSEFGRRPVSDPTRWDLPRPDVWKGRPIGLHDMTDDYRSLMAA